MSIPTVSLSRERSYTTAAKEKEPHTKPEEKAMHCGA